MKRTRRKHSDELVARLSDRSEAVAYAHARRILANNLVHTREIPNGRDFLFAGNVSELRDALRTLVEIEQAIPSQPLHLDYVLIDEYFLLRITGTHHYSEVIRTYFEVGGGPFKDFSLT
jgi:hypothetical protein